MHLRHLTALLCSALLPALALAAPAISADLHIDNAFARPTPPGATNAGAYADIDVTGESPVVLSGAHSPASETVELHVMRMQGDTMQMRQVAGIDITEDSPLTMRPGGGYHLMLIGLQNPLVEGQEFPITLEFENADNIEIQFQVAPLDATDETMDHMEADHSRH